MLLWGNEDPNKQKLIANTYEIKESYELSKNFNTLGDMEGQRMWTEWFLTNGSELHSPDHEWSLAVRLLLKFL